MAFVNDETRKRKRGRPRIDATQISVRVVPNDLAALDAWIKTCADEPSRPEAIRRLMRFSLWIGLNNQT
jgi:hypothetical protein